MDPEKIAENAPELTMVLEHLLENHSMWLEEAFESCGFVTHRMLRELNGPRTVLEEGRNGSSGIAMTAEKLAEALERHRLWSEGKGGERAVLHGVDLRGAKLTCANLRQADLRGAILCDADLFGANLSNADLRGANLHGADLAGAFLFDADLRGAVLSVANLNGADLRTANMEGADLHRANLSVAKLEGADLTGADLSGANLISANLIKADLTCAILEEANLNGAYLAGADLTGAIKANLEEANLNGAYDLTGALKANLEGSTIHRRPKPSKAEVSEPEEEPGAVQNIADSVLGGLKMALASNLVKAAANAVGVSPVLPGLLAAAHPATQAAAQTAISAQVFQTAAPLLHDLVIRGASK